MNPTSRTSLAVEYDVSRPCPCAEVISADDRVVIPCGVWAMPKVAPFEGHRFGNGEVAVSWYSVAAVRHREIMRSTQPCRLRNKKCSPNLVVGMPFVITRHMR